LIGVGAALIAAGLLWQLTARWLPLGRLPGDVAIERGGVRIYFPIASCLLVSAVLSLAVWLARVWQR
jgi:hypothetical protein